jgi:hypothetical protein
VIRYALWAAVSSKPQAAKDKLSLDEQIKAGRLLAQARGWTETAGPFLVPGQSRTRWINLSDAARAIPALEALIQSARRREFDVLIAWDLTRFRDLQKPISMLLQDFRIQLYSIASPVEIVEPAIYDPRENDSAEILQDANAMASRVETKLRQRRWRIGIRGRVESGLHYSRRPFGYRKPAGQQFDKKAVLEPDPHQARLLIQVKDRFLAGQSLWQLAAFMDASGVPAPQGGRWMQQTVKRILVNSFYAGFVMFGATRAQRDRLAGRTVTLPADPANLIHIRGRHAPLWDEATHDRILAELRRRGRPFTGKSSHALSQLLRCAVCGTTLYADSRTSAPGKVYWRCPSHIRPKDGKRHGYIRDDVVMSSLAGKLGAAVRSARSLELPAPADHRPELRAEQADLLARRRRWTDAFEAGTLSAEDFADRIRTLGDRLAAVRRDLEQAAEQVSTRQHRRTLLEQLARAADEIPGYLRDADPQEVNAGLHEILECVTVAPDRSIELTWRK